MAKRAVPKIPVRERIVRAAAELLSSGGRDAVSTRAVSAAANVHAPAIYRQFGDMSGLLDAAAREVLAGYVRQKATRDTSEDPLQGLRRGWDQHVVFGLANPAAYAIIYGGSREWPEEDAGAAREGHAMLERLVTRLAEAGRLRVSVASAARLVHAGASGVTLSLIGADPQQRDGRLSELMREAVIGAITVAPTSRVARGAHRVAARAIALSAVLGEARVALSPGERHFLGELLDRLASSS